MKIFSKLFFVCFLVLSMALTASLNSISIFAQSDRGANQLMQGMTMDQSQQRPSSLGMLGQGQMAMDQSQQRPSLGMLGQGQMAMDQSQQRPSSLGMLGQGQMAMDQSQQSGAPNQTATAAASYFYVYPGTYTIWIYSKNNDYGWTDLCGMKWKGSSSSWGQECFGFKDWSVGSNGAHGTASFYVPEGYYKYFDSCAQSYDDGWWNYGTSYNNPYADHNSWNWKSQQPSKCNY